MKRIEFTIHGQIRGGKNNYIVTRQGKHVPRENFSRWRNGVVRDLRFYLDQIDFREPFDEPLSLNVKYWNGDKRRRDVPAMLDALYHCFERAGLVTDDFLFSHVVWEGMGLDRTNPRTEISIAEI